MNIMIVEDNKQFLRNIRLILEGEPEVVVVGAFGSGEAALEALPHLSADIMLLDLGLPDTPGIELIAHAKKIQPDLAIMVYTAQTDRDILISTLKAGASGYILKGCKPRELTEAMHSLYSGGAALSPQITNAVVREFHGAMDNGSHVLSFREREIFAALEKGLSYKKIAVLLTLSVHTVHTHISNIFKKLGARNRREALVKARRMGIVLVN